MKKIGGILAGMFVSLALTVTTSALCNEPRPRLVCAEYFNTDAVVVAKLTSVRYLQPKNEMDGYLYDLRIEKVLRGNISPQFRVYEENSSGRAGFDWKRGTSYLLFLRQYPGRRGEYYLDGCGNSGPVASSSPVLRAIKTVNGRKGGMITGTIRYEYQPQLGIAVAVHGAGRSIHTKTDISGQFKVRVPPGEYSVGPIGNEWKFESDFLSYENPLSIKIGDGGCAQVQIEASKAKR